MKRYDTVVFDMDGTLLNTLEDIVDSVNFVMELHGFPKWSIEEIRNFVGNGAARLIDFTVPGGQENPEYEKCLEDYQNHYMRNMTNKTAPYEGIMELLDQLTEKGYKTAIVSNKFDEAVKKLNRHYFGKYIKVAIGQTRGVLRKPAPDTVLKALEELGSTPEKAVYVGDSEVDAMTAKNAGTLFVGVTWGFRSRNDLEREGARYIIDHPLELLKVIG